MKFDQVLMIGGDSSTMGSPNVAGAAVSATVVRESRGEKIIVFKKKHGHRQDLVELRIDSITV